MLDIDFDSEDAESRYLKAKIFLADQIEHNFDYIKGLVESFGFDYPHFEKAIMGSIPNQRVKYKNFSIDYVEHNLCGILFTVLSYMIGADTRIGLYKDICGVYQYYRFYPDKTNKFIPSPGVLIIDIVDGIPMFFHNSNNSAEKDKNFSYKNDDKNIEGLSFKYEHRGAVIMKGQNIFCIGSRESAVRSMIFQLPKEPSGTNTIKSMLKKSPVNGIVLSIFTRSKNPFSTITAMYHESYSGEHPKTAGDVLTNSGSLTWAWGFIFGNIDDAPPGVDIKPTSSDPINVNNENKAFLAALKNISDQNMKPRAPSSPKKGRKKKQ